MQTQPTGPSWAKEGSKYSCAPITPLIYCHNLKQELPPLPGHRMDPVPNRAPRAALTLPAQSL